MINASFESLERQVHVDKQVSNRRGAAFVLITAMMCVFVISAAFTINYSYMQLVRTELRSATDAAAKAGAEALARTEDTDLARQEAIRYAAANRVAGKPFLLGASDVEFGRVSPQGAGRWNFTSGGDTLNAVRINARTGNGAANSAIPLFFSSVLGRESFTPAYSATAGQQEVEVCLCLDRSGSMAFDMTGTEWAYPSGNPLFISRPSMSMTNQNYYSPPHPTASRWAALRDAVDLFLTEAGNYNPPPRTALVTWANGMTSGVSPYAFSPSASTEVSLPSASGHNWAGNMAAVQAGIAAKGAGPVIGGTNLSAGLDLAVSVLRGPSSSLHTSKVVILLTDGQWNAGRDPTVAAFDARGQGITVHTVSMLTAVQPDLQSVATITGGKYIRTSNTAELRAAFIELAHSLPVVLTD